jgi:hypothetical protein
VADPSRSFSNVDMMTQPPTSPTRFDSRLDPPMGADRSTVRLQVPLRHEFASTLRVVVASIGADIGFTVDDIDDLRLAVSEVFSSFDSGADQTAVVDMAAEATTGLDADGSNRTAVEVRIGMSTGGAQSGSIDLDELAMTIIRAAVDEFRIDAGVVTLVKRTDDAR